MKVIENVAYGTVSEAQKLDIYIPDGETKAVLIYYHGGGLDHGDKDHMTVSAPYLTERGVAVVSANYRMYPDFEYPDFLYDAASVVAFTRKYMKDELGCDELYVSGSSAGGYITMMLCFDPRYLKSVGLDNSSVTGYFHDAGQPTAHFNVLKQKGVDPRRIIIDETAPLYYIGLSESYPPMRFIVSDNDMQNRYEQTMLVLSTMKHFGLTECDHVLMHGRHCQYCRAVDEDGVAIFGGMLYSFIEKVENGGYKAGE